MTGRIVNVSEKTNSVYVYVRPSGRKRKVLVTAAKSSFQADSFIIGNRAEFWCTYRELQTARNDGNFDEKSYYNSLGIFEKYQLEDLIVTDKRSDPAGYGLYLLRQKICTFIMDITRREDGSESAEGAVICAMLTGDRSNIDENTKELFINGGIAHILAVSGLHISFIGNALYSLLRKKISAKLSAPVSFSIVCAFCVMCGLSASAVRALIMFIIRICAGIFKKRYDTLSALSVSAAALVIYEPFYITNSGFILSHLAILSICLVSENTAAFISPPFWECARGCSKRAGKLSESFISGAVISICAMPVTAGMYFSYPLYGILINVVIIPLTAYILASGLLGSVLGLLSVWAGRFMIGAGIYALEFTEMICRASEFLAAGNILTGRPRCGSVIIFYLTIAVFTAVLMIIRRSRMRRKRNNSCRSAKKKAARILICAACFVFLMCLVLIRPAEKDLVISYLDTGQGLCVLIRSPSGMNVMIDCGTTSVDGLYDYRLESALRCKKIDTLDYVFISHPDLDHMSGVLEMLDGDSKIKIKTILINDFSGNYNYDDLISAAEIKGTETVRLTDKMTLKDDKLQLTCLYSDNDIYETNDSSAVILLEYEGFRALFPGDITSKAELMLLNADSLLLPGDIDVLTVSHHGSRYSSCKEFLDSIKPETAIVSAGVNNMYGHPHTETIVRLMSAGCSIYSTAEAGEIDITVETDGSYTVKGKLQDLPYDQMLSQ